MVLQKAIGEKLLDTIKVNSDCSNRDSLPAIDVTISGQVFSVPSKIYVIKERTIFGKEVCALAAAPANTQINILGEYVFFFNLLCSFFAACVLTLFFLSKHFHARVQGRQV
jgi:Eukaryotic aspartyl protease